MTQTVANTEVANTEAEWRALLDNRSVQVIRSASDFSNRQKNLQVLAHVPAEAIAAFRDSLLFKSGGLAHAEYSMLKEHLDDQQLEKLWAAFGIGPGLLRDYRDNWCSSSHTCSYKNGSICTGLCRQ